MASIAAMQFDYERAMLAKNTIMERDGIRKVVVDMRFGEWFVIYDAESRIPKVTRNATT